MLRRLRALTIPIGMGVKRLVGSRKPKVARAPPRQVFIPNHWHAVCVDAKPLSCAVAQELRKKRFLSKEAPSLPLEECPDRLSCPCTYKHHDDRRGKPRRKEQQSFTATQKVPKAERRATKGRRADDL